MKKQKLTEKKLNDYRRYLQVAEKSTQTIEKYMRDVIKFQTYADGRAVTKELCADYKHHLIKTGYAVRSVNSMLAAVNNLLSFLGLNDFRVKQLRMQKQTYCSSDTLLTRQDYLKLLDAAKGKQICLIMQTMAATGVRVSELSAFTVEGLRQGDIQISCKGKTRTILVPSKLQKRLLAYAQKQHIKTGLVFVDSKGQPLSRSTIWRQMKRLCETAGIETSKVFPHNLRKLFARTFYRMEKDIAKLADILGHYSIETTRIYIMETGEDHRRKLEQLKLIL